MNSSLTLADLIQLEDKRPALHAAFSAVQNPTNWKLPVDCEVALTIAEAEMTREAVEFFTGSQATFRPIGCADEDGRTLFHVTAEGYYAAVGA